jgi:flagellar basal body rod protein FlgG
MRPGALRPTGNPLDVAIENERQFFVVDTPAGERLIRGGALRLDANGVLVHASGRALLGDNGPIAVPPGATIAIEADGTVRADSNVIDRLRVDAVAGPEDLAHEASGIFRPTGTRASVNVAERAIHQGFIEESNVDTLTSMVEMIEIQRAYAAVQGSMRSIDSVMETIANDIGRVG